MILEFNINEQTFKYTGETLLDAWNKEENKVFVLKSNKAGNEVRKFYEFFCTSFGKLYNLAEDVRKGNRDNQRTNKTWMEVRSIHLLKMPIDIHLLNNHFILMEAIYQIFQMQH